MNFYDLVNARYSVRSYSDKPVPEEALGRVLEAARLAPSAANKQPWHFFVVREEALRKKLFPDQRQSWIAAAPAIIIACGLPGKAWVRGSDGKNHADIDIAIAMDHIIMAATEEGLGTCWICAFDVKTVKAGLGLSSEMEPIALTPLGYATSEQGPRNRKALEEIVTWR
jgi:nitroreductase